MINYITYIIIFNKLFFTIICIVIFELLSFFIFGKWADVRNINIL
jgi:hypothetical protein